MQFVSPCPILAIRAVMPNSCYSRATVRELHARAPHARASFLARAWNARTCDARAVAAADGRFDRIVAQR
eukprot:11193817-Lingulodinium_polyedra.AAC.1